MAAVKSILYWLAVLAAAAADWLTRQADSIDAAGLRWIWVDNHSSQVSACGRWCVGEVCGTWTLYRLTRSKWMGGWVVHSDHASESEAKGAIAAAQQKGLDHG